MDTSFNGVLLVASVPLPTTFTYSQTAANASSNGGVVAPVLLKLRAVSGGTVDVYSEVNAANQIGVQVDADSVPTRSD